MDVIQSFKINITSVNDVERTRFNDEHIKHIDIMNLAIGNGDKGRYITT